VQWVARDDGHGFEIKGISGQMMRVFSSRRKAFIRRFCVSSLQAQVAGKAFAPPGQPP
jgi:hypothetical protein